MKTSDIPDEPILEYLALHQDKWIMSWDLKREVAGLADLPLKLFQSKIKSIIRRRLSGGCDCGCRADLCITDKGLEIIGAKRTHSYSGY